MLFPRGVFVTGTDTNVGKTVAAAWLIQHLEADYWKPVQSGTEEGTDADTLARLLRLPPERIHPSSYVLRAPLSPHEAARLEGIVIQPERLVLPSTSRRLVVEGAGGVLVPLTDSFLMIDLMARLGLPVAVVARSTLGTINHTLLTLEALRARRLEIAGVILNGPLDPANRDAIERFGRVRVLGHLPPFAILDGRGLAGVPLRA